MSEWNAIQKRILVTLLASEEGRARATELERTLAKARKIDREKAIDGLRRDGYVAADERAVWITSAGRRLATRSIEFNPRTRYSGKGINALLEAARAEIRALEARLRGARARGAGAAQRQRRRTRHAPGGGIGRPGGASRSRHMASWASMRAEFRPKPRGGRLPRA